jgi:transposase
VQNNTRIAVDIAKAVFEIALSDRPGRVTQTARPRRGQFLEFFAQQPAATVVMEACGSAHYWARRIEQLGHRVILLPPHQVRPYVKRNKTDRTDAKGILEASRNEDIRPVPIKTVPQQVLTSLHRLRQGWMSERTARLNAVRGLLRELGVFIPVGAEEVLPAVWALIEDADSDLPRRLALALRRGVPRDPRHRGPHQADRATARDLGPATPRRRLPAQHPRDRPLDRDRARRFHR